MLPERPREQLCTLDECLGDFALIEMVAGLLPDSRQSGPNFAFASQRLGGPLLKVPATEI